MAENIVQGLFGPYPDQYRAQVNQGVDAEAARYAQLDPHEKASYMLYKGGAGLARPVAGMFGMVDPAEQRIQQTQQILSQGGDMNTPEGLRAMAEKFRQINPSVSFGLLERARDVETRASKAALEAAQTTRALATAERESATAAKLASSEKEQKVSDFARKLTEAGYVQGTPEFSAKMREYIEGTIKGLTKPVADVRVTSEIKQSPDIVKAVDAFDESVKIPKAAYESSKLAKQLINDAKVSNNSQSWEAARTTLAKAVGETKLSNEDIRRMGTDPRFVQGGLDWLNKKLGSGVPNEDIMRQLYALSSLLERHSEQRINDKATRARQAAKASDFKGDVDVYFPMAGKQSNVPKRIKFDAQGNEVK